MTPNQRMIVLADLRKVRDILILTSPKVDNDAQKRIGRILDQIETLITETNKF